MNLLARLRNRIKFNSEDTGDVAPPVAEDTPKSTPENKDTPPKVASDVGDKKNGKPYIINGETVYLNQEQQDKLVGYGLQALAERNNQNTNESPKETETENKEVDDKDDKYISKGDFQKKENARILKTVNKIINKLENAGDKQRALNKVLTDISLAQAHKRDFDEEALAQAEVDYYTEIRQSVKNLNETADNVKKKKEETKKMATGTPSGRNTETETPKRTKSSFRDGSLTKDVMKFLGNLTE